MPSASQPLQQSIAPTAAMSSNNNQSQQQQPAAGTVPRRNAPTASGGPGSEPPHIIEGPGGRILCIADARGNLSTLNKLAAEHKAQAIIHTGDFGFYSDESLERISDRTLRHLVQYSTLIPQSLRTRLLAADPPVRGPAGAPAASTTNMRAQIKADANPLLSEFPLLLNGSLTLDVPVFTVWGACEDVAILERFRSGEYQVPNLQVLDEATTRAIEVGGVRLRLFGLGGAVVLHKLFDNGEGAATIAGGQGTMWTTILQIGELIDTAQKSFDPTETRVLITHASPGREGLLTQLALALKADLTISAGLHFRYGVSYNEFSVQHDTENYRNKLVNSKSAFSEVWETVKTQVEEVIDEPQRVLLNHALAVTSRVPPLATATGAASEEPAWKNTWNWNLPDAAFGSLVLDIKEGRIGSEMQSQGFNFAYRKNPAGSGGVGAPTVSAPSPTVAPAKAAVPAVESAAPKPAPAPPTGPRLSSGGTAGAVTGSNNANKPAPPAGPAAAPAAAASGAPSGPRGGRSSASHSRKNTGGAATNGSSTSGANTDNETGGGKKVRGGGGVNRDGKADESDGAKPKDDTSSPWDTEYAPSPRPAAPARKPEGGRGGNKRGGKGHSKTATGGETSGGEGLTSGNESSTGGGAVGVAPLGVDVVSSASSTAAGDKSERERGERGERGGRGGGRGGRGRGGAGGERGRGGRGGRGGHKASGSGSGPATPATPANGS